MKILAIDDSKVVLDLIKSQIKLLNLNIELVTANSGQDGFELSQKDQYDLILLDIQMPKPNGIEVGNMIRAHEDTHTKIYAFSAVDESLSEELLTVFDGIYNKPYDANILLTDIKNLKEDVH